jgi:hypothetical protein
LKAVDFLFLIPVIGLASEALTHVALLRGFPRMPAFTAYCAALAAGGVCVLVADILVGVKAASWSVWLDRALPDTVAYLAFGYSYFHFFNMSETGRRMRLMIELYLATGGLTSSELLQRYSPDDVVSLRIARLSTAGQIIERDGRIFTSSPSFGFALMIIFFLKWLVMGKLSEFDEANRSSAVRAAGSRK